MSTNADFNIFQEIGRHTSNCKELLKRFKSAKLTSKDLTKEITVRNNFCRNVTMLPIHYVIEYCEGTAGYFDLIKYLVDLYPDCVKVKTKEDNYGCLPIHLVPDDDGSGERLKALLFLVEKYPEGLKCKDDWGRTLLTTSIKRERNNNVNALLAKYPDLAKVKEYDGCLPIHHAIIYANVWAIEKFHSIYPEGIKERHEEKGSLTAVDKLAYYLARNFDHSPNKNKILDKMTEILPEAFDSKDSDDHIVFRFLLEGPKVAKWRQSVVSTLLKYSGKTVAKIRKELEATKEELKSCKEQLLKENLSRIVDNNNNNSSLPVEDLKGMLQSLMQQIDNHNTGQTRKRTFAYRFARNLVVNQNNNDDDPETRDDLIDTIKALHKELLEIEEEKDSIAGGEEEDLDANDAIQTSPSEGESQRVFYAVSPSTSATTEEGGERSAKRARVSLSPVQS